MEVAVPPPGYNLVNIPADEIQNAIDAFNNYQDVLHGLEQALIIRGVHVELQGRLPVEHFEQDEADQFDQALNQWMQALQNIGQHAGIDPVDIAVLCLVLQRNADGQVVAAQIYRPPAIVFDFDDLDDHIQLAAANSITVNETTREVATLPQESSGLSTGQIVGITVGSIAGASVIVAAVLALIRRSRRRRQTTKESTTSTNI